MQFPTSLHCQNENKTKTFVAHRDDIQVQPSGGPGSRRAGDFGFSLQGKCTSFVSLACTGKPDCHWFKFKMFCFQRSYNVKRIYLHWILWYLVDCLLPPCGSFCILKNWLVHALCSSTAYWFSTGDFGDRYWVIHLLWPLHSIRRAPPLPWNPPSAGRTASCCFTPSHSGSASWRSPHWRGSSTKPNRAWVGEPKGWESRMWHCRSRSWGEPQVVNHVRGGSQSEATLMEPRALRVQSQKSRLDAA